jgi:hypothetical protein
MPGKIISVRSKKYLRPIYRDVALVTESANLMLALVWKNDGNKVTCLALEIIAVNDVIIVVPAGKPWRVHRLN